MPALRRTVRGHPAPGTGRAPSAMSSRERKWPCSGGCCGKCSGGSVVFARNSRRIVQPDVELSATRSCRASQSKPGSRNAGPPCSASASPKHHGFGDCGRAPEITIPAERRVKGFRIAQEVRRSAGIHGRRAPPGSRENRALPTSAFARKPAAAAARGIGRKTRKTRRDQARSALSTAWRRTPRRPARRDTPAPHACHRHSGTGTSHKGRCAWGSREFRIASREKKGRKSYLMWKWPEKFPGPEHARVRRQAVRWEEQLTGRARRKKHGAAHRPTLFGI
jgi:hypothetical protein